MIEVAHLADDGGAVGADIPNLAAGQTNLGEFALLGHQLGSGTGGAHQLGAAAGVELDVVDHGTNGDVGDGQAVAGLDIGSGGGDDHVAGLDAHGARM